MFVNHLNIISRTLYRHKKLTILNLLGLSVGMTAFFMIMLFVKYEFSYDNFLSNHDRIVRVESEFTDSLGKTARYSPVSIPLFERIMKHPAVDNGFMMSRSFDKMYISNGDSLMYRVSGGVFATQSIFDMYELKLVSGNKEEALTSPFSVVLTQSFAEKYFGTFDPIGKTFRIDNQFNAVVKAIIEDFPNNSHLGFNFLMSFSTAESVFLKNSSWHWGSLFPYTYLLLKDGSKIEELKTFDDFPKVLKDGRLLSYSYVKLSDIHLFPKSEMQFKPGVEFKDIILLITVALSILLAACFNYVNFSSAYAINRAKEVAIKKVVGAEKSKLIFQFLGEAVLLAFIAMVIAIFILEFTVPVFNNILKSGIDLHSKQSLSSYLFLLIITIVTGLLSGIYPTYLLINYNPVEVFKGGRKKRNVGVLVRKLLVVGQYLISIILIVLTVFVIRQSNFIYGKDLGFTKEKLLTVSFLNPMIEPLDYFRDIKKEIKQLPEIENITVSYGMPMMKMAKLRLKKINKSDVKIHTSALVGDNDFCDVLKFNFIETWDVDDILLSDTLIVAKTYVNESFVKEHPNFDYQRAIIEYKVGIKSVVAGIVSDFHYRPLKNSISPCFINVLKKRAKMWDSPIISIRFNDYNKKVKADIFNILNNSIPNMAFNFELFETMIDMNYENIKITAKLGRYFTFLAIFISAIGAFGLVVFNVKHRTKEIGIRKANGAQIFDILWLIIRQTLILLSISIFVAFPISYFGVKYWLSMFSYHVPISIDVYIFTAFFMIFMSILVISYQAYKSAILNPSLALRYE